jgi:hypothetical protein
MMDARSWWPGFHAYAGFMGFNISEHRAEFNAREYDGLADMSIEYMKLMSTKYGVADDQFPSHWPRTKAAARALDQKRGDNFWCGD